jgi:hypothetical protein
MAINHGPRLSPLAFSPALWLDFSDASTLFTEVGGSTNVSAGGAIAQVNDKSGNLRHAVQGSVGNRPTRQVGVVGGRDVSRYDGANRFLSCGDTLDLGTGGLTIFAVAKYNTTGDGTIIAKSLFAGLAGRYALARISADGGMVGIFQNATTYYNAAFVDSLQSQRILQYVIDRQSGAQSIFDNGTLKKSNTITVESANLNTSSRLLIGAYNNATDTGIVIPLNGDIAEIIVYPTALTSDQRQRVEKYLNEKYNVY